MGRHKRYNTDAIKQVSIERWLDISRAKRASATETHCPCPRCGGKDRFALKRTPDGEKWFCRQCTGSDRWGDNIAFIQWLQECDFKTACEVLGGASHTIIVSRSRRRAIHRRPSPPPPAKILSGDTLRQVKAIAARSDDIPKFWEYIQSRGISEDIAIAATLGWNDKYGNGIPIGLTIPCFDSHDWHVAQLRYCKVRPPDGGYRHVEGGGVHPYTLRGGWAHDNRPTLLCENELDALTLESDMRGCPVQIIALGGAGMCRKFDLPRRFLYDVFDNDDAGREASQHWQSKRLMDRYTEYNDPGDLPREFRIEILNRLAGNT